MENSLLFFSLLFVVSFLYASVGHGGASGYLALMIIFVFPESELKSTALVLNCCVSSISFLMYLKQREFDLKIFFWVIVLAMPLAYLGGSINVNQKWFRYLLGGFLLFSAIKLSGLFDKKRVVFQQKKLNAPLAMTTGGIIGFVSGLIGIGGGILLTPILYLFKWADIKKAAGISALFIFVNSLAGLFGQYQNQLLHINENVFMMVPTVIVGGALGAYLGSSKWKPDVVKYALSIVLLIATYKLFFS